MHVTLKILEESPRFMTSQSSSESVPALQTQLTDSFTNQKASKDGQIRIDSGKIMTDQDDLPLLLNWIAQAMNDHKDRVLCAKVLTLFGTAKHFSNSRLTNVLKL